MAEEGENIRIVNRERLLAGEPVEDKEGDTCMERVNKGEPGDASHLSLLERCCVKFENSYCPYAPFSLAIPCVLIVLGLYAVINETYMEYGSVAFIVGAVTLFIGFYLWRYRARITSRDVVAAVNPSFPYSIQTLTTTDGVRSRSGQVPAIDAGNASSSSAAHLPDPDVPGPSSFQPPSLPASEEHSCPHLESDKRPSGPKSPHSERQSVLPLPVSRESSATRTLSEVASSITQIAAESVSKREENVATRKAATREQPISDASDDTGPVE